MTPTRSTLASFALLALTACAGASPSAPPPAPAPSPSPAPTLAPAPLPATVAPRFDYPPTRRDDTKDTLFGTTVADPYRWLEDAKSPDVQAWMKAEDDFTRKRLADLPERDAIAARLRELFYVDSTTAPSHRGHRYFYSKRGARQEKWVVYWKEGKGGTEKVLLDPNAWSADGSTALGGYFPSWDGTKVAYSVKQNNSDEAVLYVMDVASGKKSEVDVIDGVKYAHPQWTPNGDGFYYTRLPTDPSITVADRPGYAELRFHKLGEDPKKDRLVHEKTGDPRVSMEEQLGKDGRWLFLSLDYGWSKSDLYVQDLVKAPGKWQPVVVGKDALFTAHAYKDRFYVHTNYKAPHYRSVVIDTAHMDEASWREIVPERKDATLVGTSLVGGALSLHWLKDVASRVEVVDLTGKPIREIKLPGLGAATALFGQPDDDDAYYSFASFTTPTEIHETSVKTGKDTIYDRESVPVDSSKFVVEQETFASKDGTTVPMFIVRGKDVKKDGATPTILYGYGGFQLSQVPSFRSSIFPWLERGGIYAVANLRGGSEYGEAWHRAGMLHDKQNVFDDFIGAAEHLVKAGYTSPSKLAILGRSNGGLLVGAAMVQRPDLFRVVLCGVPLLDMVRYHLFGSGKTWIGEYGSAENEDDFKALYAYSPYHHVVAGTKYPSLLMLSVDSDDRVDPMHARKFVAAVQNASSGGVALLSIQAHAGHAGADLVKAEVERVADEYAFALSEMKTLP